MFVGLTTTVQIAVTRPGGTTASAPQQQAETGPAKPDLGYIPANIDQPFGQNINAVLISPPQAPMDNLPLPSAVAAPGQPPNIISRAQWGADESMRCPNTVYDNGVRAGVVHHTAGSNDYEPQDSAAIVRSIYAYHTRTLGWCDIAYNALVDKYGQVFEGRAGGMTRPVEGAHTGGFNEDTWGVAMLGDFDVVPPTPIQLRTVGRLLGWRLGMDHVDPRGTVVLTSAGGSFTHFPAGATPTLPTIFTHRDVGNTDCPGNAAYAVMDQIRDIAARFNDPPGPPQPGRLAARRRDLRPVGVDGRRRTARSGAPTITGGVRRGNRPLRHASRRARSTGRRRAGPNPSPARSTTRGRRSATSAARSACRPAARSRSRSGSCRTSSTAR